MQRLLRDYHSTGESRIHTARARQTALVVADGLCKKLEGLPTMRDLPADMQPQDFPRPPKGTERTVSLWVCVGNY